MHASNNLQSLVLTCVVLSFEMKTIWKCQAETAWHRFAMISGIIIYEQIINEVIQVIRVIFVIFCIIFINFLVLYIRRLVPILLIKYYYTVLLIVCKKFNISSTLN